MALCFFHIQASDGFLEPTLEELGQELKMALSDVGGILFEQLGSRLPLFSSPEDLFQFFVTLRGKCFPVSLLCSITLIQL